MPLAFPVYRRLRGGPRNTKTLNPKLNIALAIFFAVVAILHALVELPRLLRSHKNGWEVVLHAAIATGWLIMSIEYVRRAATKQPPSQLL
jgi:hypothetical protein